MPPRFTHRPPEREELNEQAGKDHLEKRTAPSSLGESDVARLSERRFRRES